MEIREVKQPTDGKKDGKWQNQELNPGNLVSLSINFYFRQPPTNTFLWSFAGMVENGYVCVCACPCTCVCIEVWMLGEGKKQTGNGEEEDHVALSVLGGCSPLEKEDQQRNPVLQQDLSVWENGGSGKFLEPTLTHPVQLSVHLLEREVHSWEPSAQAALL